MADEYDQCQGDGTERCRVHDDLGGVIGIVAKFHGIHGRIDGGRNSTVDEEDDSSNGRECTGDEGIGNENHGQADGRQYEKFEKADNPYFPVKPVNFCL